VKACWEIVGMPLYFLEPVLSGCHTPWLSVLSALENMVVPVLAVSLLLLLSCLYSR